MEIAVAGESDYLFVEVAGLITGLTMTCKVYDLAAMALESTLAAAAWSTPGTYRTTTKFAWGAEKQYLVVWEGAEAKISKTVQVLLPGSPLWGQVAAKKAVRAKLATAQLITVPLATTVQVDGALPFRRMTAPLTSVVTVRAEVATEVVRTLVLT